MKDIDITLVGRIAIDFNPTDMHKPLSESSNFNKYLGGSPANIAIGLARMGSKVNFLGKVSNDQFGEFVINYFDKEGIDTTGIVKASDGENLGLTFTEIKSETESSILMYRDGVADLNYKPSEVDEEIIKRSKVILISGTALSKSPSREATLKAIELAKKHDVRVIFDIDYRNYSWDSNDSIALYYSIVASQSEIIIGSREEFDLMEQIYMKNNNSDEDTAKYLFENGSKIVIIKHGSEGSCCYTSSGELYKVKIFPIKLLKSFGGGDAYASAFIKSLSDEFDISDALLHATAHAAMLVSSHSCSEDMKSIAEIKKFIEESGIGKDDIVSQVL